MDRKIEMITDLITANVENLKQRIDEQNIEIKFLRNQLSKKLDNERQNKNPH